MLRRFPLLAPLLAAALAVAACADVVQPAVEGDGWSLTHDELRADVEAWAANDVLVGQLQAGQPGLAPRGDGIGTYDQSLVRGALSFAIQAEVYATELERRGLVLDDEARRQGEEILAQSGPEIIEGFPQSYQDRLVDLAAAQQVLFAEITDDAEFEAFSDQAFGDVRIDPRYGSWDLDQGGIVPVPGPLGASGLFLEA